MKTMTISWAIASGCLGLALPVWASDAPARHSPQKAKATPQIVAPAKPAAPRTLPPSAAQLAQKTETKPTAAVPGGFSATHAGTPEEQPAREHGLVSYAVLNAEVRQNPHPGVSYKEYGGLLYDVFATPHVLQLFNPLAPDDDANTVYDPITGRASGVCLFRIKLGR